MDRRRHNLNCTANKGHRALRASVYRRDGYRCVVCGLGAMAIPDGYDGHYALYTQPGKPLVIDHVVPVIAGGRLEFANLQTLCQSCNSIKGGYERG